MLDVKCSLLFIAFQTFKRAHDGYSPVKYSDTRRSLNINQVVTGDSRPIRLARVHDDVTPDTSDGDEGKETVKSMNYYNCNSNLMPND